MDPEYFVLSFRHIQPLSIIHNYPKLSLNPSQSDVKLMSFPFATQEWGLEVQVEFRKAEG